MPRLTHCSRLAAACLLPLLAFSALLSGCQRKAPTGEVSGRVTVGGSPVQFGTIAFIVDGRAAVGTIQDGNYLAKEIPTGTARITVEAVRQGTPSGNPKFGPLPAMPPPGPFVAVPKQYSSPKTTPLELEIGPGAQTKDFDLAP